MVIFHSYVELPEGSGFFEVFGCFWKVNDVFINHREMRELIHGCLKSNHFFFRNHSSEIKGRSKYMMRNSGSQCG
jgi:hypothetical protein